MNGCDSEGTGAASAFAESNQQVASAGVCSDARSREDGEWQYSIIKGRATITRLPEVSAATSILCP